MANDITTIDEIDVNDFLTESSTKKKETKFGTIYLHLDSGSVSFRQRWKYEFIIEPGAAALSDTEKADYHGKIATLIASTWSSQRPLPNIPGAPSDPISTAIAQLLNTHNGILFSVTGTSEFAKKFETHGVPIDVSVLLHASNPHWKVKVFRPKPGDETLSKYRDEVDAEKRRIRLNFSNSEPHSVCTDVKPVVCQPGFVTPTHEFGHTIHADDEYMGGKHLKDTASIMNIGTELRGRHFRWIVTQLNTMLAHTKFALPSA